MLRAGTGPKRTNSMRICRGHSLRSLCWPWSQDQLAWPVPKHRQLQRGIKPTGGPEAHEAASCSQQNSKQRPSPTARTRLLFSAEAYLAINQPTPLRMADASAALLRARSLHQPEAGQCRASTVTGRRTVHRIRYWIARGLRRCHCTAIRPKPSRRQVSPNDPPELRTPKPPIH